MRVLMVSHEASHGGMNTGIALLLRRRPEGVEGFWAFLNDGPLADAVEVPSVVINSGRAREVWRAPGVIRRLQRAIREFDADLVFAHVSKSQLYASPAARLSGVPSLWWQHERIGQKPLMHQIAGRLPAGAVICSANYTAVDQRAHFPRAHVVTVLPGIEVDQWGPPREHRQREEVVIGVVARMQRWKRVELAIRAMPAVIEAVPTARLRVIGGAVPGLDDDYPAELAAEAARAGVTDRVELAGYVPDLRTAMRELDVMVHCAEGEPFGQIVLEAMVSGVPVVAADEGGPRESVRHGVDGLLVDPTDTPALADAIVALARDPERRMAMAAAGRERVLADFTAERMAEQAWKVALEVAADGRRRRRG